MLWAWCFFTGSPRFVGAEQAAEISQVVDDSESSHRVLKVGLFVDAAAEDGAAGTRSGAFGYSAISWQ